MRFPKGTTGGSGGTCTDRNTYCPSWANDGECSANPSYMLTYCRKSCKQCNGGTTNGNCRNKDSRCRGWRSYCGNNRYVDRNCKQTCETC
uniref:ShKT domain-containing protein n=1 Tax=Ciona intestinalis TaxID=7719 RepID=H2XRW8_CIOIN